MPRLKYSFNNFYFLLQARQTSSFQAFQRLVLRIFLILSKYLLLLYILLNSIFLAKITIYLVVCLQAIYKVTIYASYFYAIRKIKNSIYQFLIYSISKEYLVQSISIYSYYIYKVIGQLAVKCVAFSILQKIQPIKSKSSSSKSTLVFFIYLQLFIKSFYLATTSTPTTYYTLLTSFLAILLLRSKLVRLYIYSYSKYAIDYARLVLRFYFCLRLPIKKPSIVVLINQLSIFLFSF